MKNINDAVSPQSTDGFIDGNTNPALNDYEYDQNGNMVKDRNKGITEIKYNHLNLPTEITWSNTKYINYQYNAAGQKVSKTVRIDADSIKVVDYLDGFQYAGEVLQFFPHPEGYVKVTALSAGRGLPTSDFAFNYVFNYTDHLGNVRLSYTKDPQTGTLEILDEDHYYPFGLKHGVYATGGQKGFRLDETGTNGGIGGIGDVELINILKTDYNYKYNGKELQDELGLDWYDYGARNYDATIGRWMNMDPLAEKSRRYSPYNYAFNNPVYFIDPDGMMATPPDLEVEKLDDGTYKVVGGEANADKSIYVVENGKRTGEVIGEMLTEYSFHSESGDAITGAVIDMSDTSGIDFLNNEIINSGIGLGEYMVNATGGESLDFKARGDVPEGMTDTQHNYRGGVFQSVDGIDGGTTTTFASARDIGNVAAGYMAGKEGMPWGVARVGFDALESAQQLKPSTEGQPTQQAQRVGHSAGLRANEYSKFGQKPFTPPILNKR